MFPSYKVWYKYLGERRRDVQGTSPADPIRKDVNNCYERALVFMHKMPRIWTDYLEFLTEQRLITRVRRTFDAALQVRLNADHRVPLTTAGPPRDAARAHLAPVHQGTPVSHHAICISVLCCSSFAATMPRRQRCVCTAATSWWVSCSCWAHFVCFMTVQLNRSAMEDYIEYLVIIKRFDDAAVKLVEIINDDKYVSAKGKSKHEVGQPLDRLVNRSSYCSCGWSFPSSFARTPRPSCPSMYVCMYVRILGSAWRFIPIPIILCAGRVSVLSRACSRVQVDAILRSGIRKFTDMVGKLWNSLADFYIRRANFDKVRVPLLYVFICFSS